MFCGTARAEQPRPGPGRPRAMGRSRAASPAGVPRKEGTPSCVAAHTHLRGADGQCGERTRKGAAIAAQCRALRGARRAAGSGRARGSLVPRADPSGPLCAWPSPGSPRGRVLTLTARRDLALVEPCGARAAVPAGREAAALGPRRLGGDSRGGSAMCAAAAGLLPPPRPGAGEPWLRRSIRTASSIHYNNPLSKQSAGAAGTTRPRCKQSSGDAANDINKITINSPLTPARPPWESPGAASRS